MSQKYTANTGKDLIFSDELNFINIKSNRKIVKLDNPKFEYYEINNNYICGESDEIETFLTNNFLEKNELTKIELKKANKKTISPSSESSTSRKQEDSDSEELIPKMNRIKTEDSDSENSIFVDKKKATSSKSNQNVFIPKTLDVKDVPEEEIQNMEYFTFNNLKVKGKIIKVIDGETIEILLGIPFSDLLKSKHIYSKDTHSFIFIKKLCKLKGIKSANFNTQQGQACIYLLHKYFESLNNIVYVKMYDSDKIELFSDKGYKNLINTKLSKINISEFAENGIINIVSEEESEYLNNLPNMKEDEYFDKTFIDKYEIDKIE